jgi:iron complex outermembrane receptor protein
VTNVADALQQIAGIDVRRRTSGTQADLYIRGGSFDQTLLLVDGFKLDDVQTGHHSMLCLLKLLRIEIIKGPASRVFGQNAFTGAVNIVTKLIMMLHYVFRRVLMASLVLLLPRELV